MEDKYFKTDAKQIVDILFDTKVFKDDMTRDDFNNLEEFIWYLLILNVLILKIRTYGEIRENTRNCTICYVG